MIQVLTPTATLVDRTYQAILDAICQGTLMPGERLTQNSIAERLEVSRQPVGQALALLKARGFVAEAGRRGLVVVPLDPDLFKEIYQLRAAIDPMAARLAAGRISIEDERVGREIIRSGIRACSGGKLDALVQADVDFHTWIYQLSGNRLVPEMMGHYWNHLRRAMGEVLQSAGKAQLIWVEHQEIFRALTGHDGERAARLTQEHLESNAARVMAVVEGRERAAGARSKLT